MTGHHNQVLSVNMSLQYVNRRGDRYYVLQGKTETGKPKYYCSKKNDGVPVESLPDGFEIHEAPAKAIVSIRKIRPSRIMASERELVVRLARELAKASAVIVDVDGDSLVVYASDADPERATDIIRELVGSNAVPDSKVREWITLTAQYSAALRFTLTDEENRRYNAERWCFRGSVDNWTPLAYEMDFEPLLRRFLPEVGQESFYDLM
jgi:hypothetical protein